MSEDKRKRSPNWLPSEKELLLELVEFHFSIIENKNTDGVTIKTKLAQWQIIADQYNSRTTHCSRTGENLKAQWESMKKVARKEAANNRKHMIQTGGGSSRPLKKEDHVLNRTISLLTTSAVGLFNPYDSDSIIPVTQESVAIPTLQTEIIADPLSIHYEDIITVPQTSTKDKETSENILLDTQELVKKDWGDYTPQLLRTPVSRVLKDDKNETKLENRTPTHRAWTSRRRPTHTATTSSLEQLYKKKMEAIDLQNKLATEEMDRAKVLNELDIQIKKEILRQEKIKTSILIIKRKRLLALKKN